MRHFYTPVLALTSHHTLGKQLPTQDSNLHNWNQKPVSCR